MPYAPESSPLHSRLPASIALLIAVLWCPLSAQSTLRIGQDARFTKTATATTLGTLLTGATVTGGRTSGSRTEITIEGWMPAAALGPFDRDGFDRVVTRRPNEALRSAPEGTVIARVSPQVGFVHVETRGTWSHVRRTVWVDTRALEASSGAAPVSGPDAIEVSAPVPMAASAEGAAIGQVDSGATGRVLARTDGWARIQLEVWVPDSAVRSLDQQALVGVSQAEVRANPARYIGKVVEWRLQFIAVQKADELRPEIPSGQPYLLTRGPLPEPGFVYVAIPSNRVAEFEALPALQELRIRGTIRASATKYLPTPVIDLVEVVGGTTRQ